MDVRDKGLNFLPYENKPRLLIVNENQLHPPPLNLLLAGFPIAKACLLSVQGKNFPYYYFFHSQHING